MVLIRIFAPSKLKNGIKSLSTLQSTASTSTQQTEMPETDFKPPEYKGPSFDNVQQIRKDHIPPNFVTYYKTPLLLHKGHMQWLFDHTGKRYLDMFGGIVTVSVGHCHPKVNKALETQLKTLWHTTNVYLHPKIHEYAERLTSKFPGDLKVVYFVNSGSEANDLAMLLARLHTGNFDILTLRNSYHGMSPYTMGLTAHSTWRFSLPGINSGIQHVMNPDPYLGIWGGSNCRDSPVQTNRQCSCEPKECEASEQYYNQLEQVFKFSLPRGKVAGMFVESIQGVGGAVQFPKNYIKKAAQLIKANGGLFIADEVQSGFGRTGDHFWGFEGHGIIPDVVTLAKGIGNGFPLAAVVTTPAIAECLTQALHFNTYGGNPLACAVGISVLDVIEEERLQKNALEVGTYLLKGLAELRDKYPVIGDVRGKGLMIGVEFVSNPETRQPLSVPHMIEIWDNCKEAGVLLGRGGINGNVLRIKPPMCVTQEDADYTLFVLENTISEYHSKKERSCHRNINCYKNKDK